MEINVNGLREALIEDLNKLGEYLLECANNDDVVDDDILDMFDAAAQNANFLNCVYVNEDESFSDMSTQKINYISRY